MGWCDQIADPAVARTVTKIVCYPVGLLISELFRLGCGVLEDEWCPAAFSDQRFSTIGGLILASVVVEHFSKVISVKLWTSREHLDRISLSLNILTLPAAGAAGPSAQPKRQLRLRTLWEKQLDEIIPNKGGRAIFRKTARGSNSAQASYPFLEDTEINHDLVINYFVNAISSICDTNFVSSELGQPVVEKAFVFGLTFEELPATAKQQAAHVRKVRVLLMREDSLDEMSRLTLEKNGGTVELQSKGSYHEDRFDHLHKMAFRWRQEKKRGKKMTGEPRSYLGTVKLCVPDLQELRQEVRQLRAELLQLSPPPTPVLAGFSGMRYSSSAASLDSPSQTLDDSAASRELLPPLSSPDSRDSQQRSTVELDRSKGSLRFRSSAQAVHKGAYQADEDRNPEEPEPESL